eukprot:Blabericola_migrator_1__5150@NODE_2659_length_2488_cov_402_197439_g1665_i0_p3_GENE_NODE_2659_length_2488_cov_402_197439_g1665_i0NODE_2659_length_2488_cov_402_197439_g1665_i0_p3_ORF_typecomplete_len188_score26_63EFhand_7/PF13499_6/0_0026EFhand_11/PF08976_11/0_045EFhand_11/PF08976_11/2_3e03EFhand_5/PF13202_6/0_047EFhand_6/PF13405_6/0_048EFhand_8/PF13833_6/29EFhand_8/PF13833_6/12EFhand_8/PF13833_6/3_2e02_NODE_2659_length_2488_cov_402_197439_g1665_i018602423
MSGGADFQSLDYDRDGVISEIDLWYLFQKFGQHPSKEDATVLIDNILDKMNASMEFGVRSGLRGLSGAVLDQFCLSALQSSQWGRVSMECAVRMMCGGFGEATPKSIEQCSQLLDINLSADDCTILVKLVNVLCQDENHWSRLTERGQKLHHPVVSVVDHMPLEPSPISSRSLCRIIFATLMPIQPE